MIIQLGKLIWLYTRYLQRFRKIWQYCSELPYFLETKAQIEQKSGPLDRARWVLLGKLYEKDEK